MAIKKEGKNKGKEHREDYIFGKPVSYTPKELKEKADDYKEMCKTTIIDRGINGKIHKPFTVSGFNLFAGIHKNYLSEKAKIEDYTGTIAYIRGFIENDVEEKALTGVYSPGASSFNLKNNFGWKDKVESVNVVRTLDELTDEEQKDLDELMEKS